MTHKQVEKYKAFVDTRGLGLLFIIYIGVHSLDHDEQGGQLSSFKCDYSLKIDYRKKQCTYISKDDYSHYSNDYYSMSKMQFIIPTFAKKYNDKSRIVIESIFEGFGER